MKFLFSNFDNAVYTYFSQDELATKAELWADVQIASYAGGELLGAAAQGARTFFLELKGAKNAAKVADEFAEKLAKDAELQIGPERVNSGSRGTAKVEAQTVDEAHEPLAGADADSATATRTLIPKRTGCFVSGTPVLMADGSFKAIELVRVGDKVVSKDEKTGEIAAKSVTNISVRYGISTLKLHLGDGSVLETTDEHPIYIEGKGFVPAKEAGIGSSVLTRAGPAIAFTKIERDARKATVYNFTVADFHTYFVGKSQLWVHNAVFCNEDLLDEHFEKHGTEFGALTKEQYEQQASSFMTGTKTESTMEGTRANGDILRYNPLTGEFGIITKDGVLRTYSKPNPAQHGFPDNIAYFEHELEY